MNEHDAELLHRALELELSEADSDELRALYARQPELRERVSELVRLARDLDQHASDERRAIDHARSTATAEDRASMAAAFARAHPQRAPATKPRRVTLWLAAAAVIVTCGEGVYWLTRPAPAPISSGVLGHAEKPACVAPIGAGANMAEFTWKAPAISGASYRLRIHERLPDGSGGRLLVDEPCNTTTWTPTAEQQTKFGASITWRVGLLLPDGSDPIYSDEVSASR